MALERLFGAAGSERRTRVEESAELAVATWLAWETDALALAATARLRALRPGLAEGAHLSGSRQRIARWVVDQVARPGFDLARWLA